MPVERKLIPCEEDDPHRCIAQGMQNEGQCKFLAVEGQKYCPCHGGINAAMKVEKKKIHDYRLQAWQARLDEFSESDQVKNLRGEIGVLRILIETIFQQCQTPTDLMIYSGKIGDLVTRIEKLTVSCDRFETKVGMLLDKTKALALAGKIVEIIAKEVTDAEAIDRISNGIITVIANLSGISSDSEEVVADL